VKVFVEVKRENYLITIVRFLNTSWDR